MAKKKLSTEVIQFIECLVVPEGQLVGQPFKLLPFQKRFIREVYDNPHGTRHGYLSIARKNGKTALLAALLLAHIVGPCAIKNSQVVSGARSRDQAALVWSLAVKMIDLMPDLQDITHTVPSSKRIYGLPMNVEYRALSADGAKNMGISPNFILMDEVGQVIGDKDYFTDALTSSQGAYENPLLLAISTQAPSDADMWSIWLDDATRSGDKHTISHVYEAKEGCELMDKVQWRKANPALGKFLNYDYVRQQMEKATRLPSEEAKARNLLLNQRVAQESLWLAPQIWKDNNAKPNWGIFRQYGVHIGLDLSKKNDLTCAVIAAKDDDGKIHTYPFGFTPMTGLDDRSKKDRVPYNDWVRDGVLFGVPGQTIDYEWIAQFLKVHLAEKGIETMSIQFDRWRINDMKAAAERELFAGDAEWNEVGQGYQSMSPRIEAAETVLMQSRVCHGSHPILNLGAASAIAVQDPSGNKKLDKTKASNKIDAIVAFVMAIYPLASQTDPVFDIGGLIG